MGFEQLAPLKAELEKQAIAQKQAQKRKLTEGKAAKTAAIDPVVRTIGLLQKHFPLAFPKKPNPKVPLKIAIHKDLFAHSEALGLSQNEIRAALKKWCRGRRYAECLVAGAARVDLQGNEVGYVTKEEAAQSEQTKATVPPAATP